MYLPPFTSPPVNLLTARSEMSASGAEIAPTWVSVFFFFSIHAVLNKKLLTAFTRRLEPDGRGTFGILRSCIVTLALCVYTAIHLNIPAAKDSKWAIYLRKAKWVAIAMFAPELVVYVAWCQRREVARLHREVVEELKTLEQRSGKRRRHAWTIAHSWYAYMGGFVIDTVPDESEEVIIEGSPRVILKNKALCLVASRGWLPDSSSMEIEDKSKADGFAKGFATIQSSWMILQCIMRWSSGLFVTEIELNTLAHAVCALAIFILWWDKPHDIEQPTILQGDWTRPLAALLWSTKLRSGHSLLPREWRGSSLDFTSSTINYKDLFYQEAHDCIWIDPSLFPDDNEAQNAPAPSQESNQTTKQEKSEASGFSFRADAVLTDTIRIYNYRTGIYSSRAMEPSQSAAKLPTFCLQMGEVVVMSSTAVGLQPRRSYANMITNVELDRAFLVRWKMIWDWLHWLDRRGFAVDRLSPPTAVPTSSFLTPRNVQSYQIPRRHMISHGICFRTLNWCSVDPRDETTGLMSLSVFIGCAIAYGGIHAAAWRDHFPTLIEKRLWRVSCIYISSLGVATWPIVAGLHALETAYLKGSRAWQPEPMWRDFIRSFSPGSHQYRRYLFYPGAILLAMGVLGYLAARVYLVVEAFISLRSVPASAYHTPDWTQYLPHL